MFDCYLGDNVYISRDEGSFEVILKILWAGVEFKLVIEQDVIDNFILWNKKYTRDYAFEELKKQIPVKKED